jgi:hypothetical protein
MLPLRKEKGICRLTYSPTTTYQNNIFGPDHPEYLSEDLLFWTPESNSPRPQPFQTIDEQRTQFQLNKELKTLLLR